MRPLWACPTAVGIATTTRTRMCGRSSSSSRRIIAPGSVGRGGGVANAGGGKLGAMLAPIFLACMVAPPQSAMAWLQPPPRVEFTAGSARVGGRAMGMGGRGGRMRPSGVGLVHVRCLNRLILEENEMTEAPGGDLVALIDSSDRRAKHVKKIIKTAAGGALRVGVVDRGCEEDALVDWVEGGNLRLTVPAASAATVMEPVAESQRPRIDLLLALPRPTSVIEFLNTATQQGVDRVILCNAAKVQADYFGSHVLREPKVMRDALKEGLAQAGTTALPRVHVARRLKVFLEDELDDMCPDTVRVVAHPQKEWLPPLPRLRDIQVPEGGRILIAVGPEAGWSDPFELELLAKHGFQAISLGSRTLRTDVALNALLALAHDRLDQ